MQGPWTTDLLRQLRRRDADEQGSATTGRRDAADAYVPPETDEAQELEAWVAMRRQFGAWG